MTYVRAIERIANSNNDIPTISQYIKAIKDRNNEHNWIRVIIFDECPGISGAFLNILLEKARERREHES